MNGPASPQQIKADKLLDAMGWECRAILRDGEWQPGGSVWGIEAACIPGDDYVWDIMDETLEALRRALQSRCPHCRRPQ